MYGGKPDSHSSGSKTITVKKLKSGRHKGKWKVTAPRIPQGTLRSKETAMNRAKQAKKKLENDPLCPDDVEIEVKE
ncbi:hypothetical protein [Haloarcula vallismortis]|uniref:hypothetical protein n=1 Tax=Haloarcula vallismortis TaxID=28442 RepID=UPI000678274D|nr:hypothetical protein [Haloarcula vallismortis]